VTCLNPNGKIAFQIATFTNILSLLIPEDENGLKMDNYVLFGRANATTNKIVIVNSPRAYVAFYGSYHETAVTGFEIRYSSIQGKTETTVEFYLLYMKTKPKLILSLSLRSELPGTTVEPTTTSTLPSFGSPPKTLAPIDSAKEVVISSSLFNFNHVN